MLDARSAHLDDDVAPAAGDRSMDLRDRRGRDRRLVDACERVDSDLLLDHAPDLGEIDGRHLVDEAAELLDVDVR